MQPLFPGIHEVTTSTTHEDRIFTCRWTCLCGKSGAGDAPSPASASTKALEEFRRVCIEPAKAMAAAIEELI